MPFTFDDVFSFFWSMIATKEFLATAVTTILAAAGAVAWWLAKKGAVKAKTFYETVNALAGSSKGPLGLLTQGVKNLETSVGVEFKALNTKIDTLDDRTTTIATEVNAIREDGHAAERRQSEMDARVTQQDIRITQQDTRVEGLRADIRFVTTKQQNEEQHRDDQMVEVRTRLKKQEETLARVATTT